VVGERSGGGSGRPRSVPLLRTWRLTISTVLTYDRSGRCVEGAGLPVDVEVPAFELTRPDPVLVAAEAIAA
jgi:carboxyl-terminal processing protease